MKKLSYFISLACLALFASCSSDVEDFNVLGKHGKTLTLNVGLANSDTRVEFQNQDIQKGVWKTGDQVQLQGYSFDGKKAEAALYLTCQTGGSSSFTGKIIYPNGYHEYNVTDYKIVHYITDGNGGKVYYYIKNNGLIKMDCHYELQKQSQINDPKHIANHTLYTTVKDRMTLDDIKQGVSLLPNGSVLDLNIKNLPAEIASATEYTVKYFINYDPQATDQVPAAVLNYTGSIDPSSNNNHLFLAFAPNTLTGNIGFEITANAKTCKAYHASAGKTYVAGKVYTTTLNYANAAAEEWTWELPESGGGTEGGGTEGGGTEGGGTGGETEESIVAIPLNYRDSLNSYLPVGFTVEGTGGYTNIWEVSQDWQHGNVLMGSNYAKTDNGETTSYLVTPYIQLTTNNVATFDYYSRFLTGTISFCIRTFNGEWQEVNLEAGDANWATYTYNVGAAYNNKKVQFAFKYYDANPGNAGDWFIKNLEVKGDNPTVQ